MPSIPFAAARRLRSFPEARGATFVFAFQDLKDLHRATHVVVSALKNGWLAGDGEARWGLTVRGPEKAPYRCLVLERNEHVSMIDADGERHPGFFSFVDPADNHHVLWRRFASHLPDGIWDRLPVTNPLSAIGKRMIFTSKEDAPLRLDGPVIGLRSVEGEPHGCFVTMDAGRMVPDEIIMDPEDRWKLRLRDRSVVHGEVVFS